MQPDRRMLAARRHLREFQMVVCEDGLVHYCSQQRGHPGIPLEKYGPEDIRREYFTQKSCAPYCTISCVHQVSVIDRWRDPQTRAFNSDGRGLVKIETNR